MRPQRVLGSRRSLLPIGLALVFALSAVGAAASTSKTALGPIKIGVGVTVIPGYYDSKEMYDPAVKAALAYIKDRGGWGGRAVTTDECVSPGDPASDTKCYNQFVSNGDTAVIGIMANQSNIGLPTLGKSQIPSYTVGVNGTEDKSPWQDSFGGGGIGAVTTPAWYACAKGLKKISFVTEDSALRSSNLAQYANGIFSSCHIDVNLVKVPMGTADIAPFVQKAVASNPQLVIVVLGNPGAKTIVNQFAAVHFPATKLMIVAQIEQQFLGNPNAVGALFVTNAQLPVRQNPDPDIKSYRRYMAKVAPGFDVFTQLSLPAFQEVVMVWQAAKAVGFAKATGATIQRYMNKKAPGTMHVFAGGTVSLLPGLPGNKYPYDIIYRFKKGSVQFLGFWPAVGGCTSQATCAKGLKLK
jgi:hypothetical protein